MATIKILHFQGIFDYICESLKANDEQEIEIEKVCCSIEESKDFKKLFFFIDNDTNEYFYLEENEKAIKDYISKYYDISDYKYNFKEYTTWLWEMRDNDDIEIKTHLGTMFISEDNFLTSLDEEFLSEDMYIERLVNAEDFYTELAKIKKECLDYLFDIHIDCVRSELRDYKF